MPAIKISGITNNSDAKWAAILGVEYVTVSMDEESEKKVSLQKALEIRNMLPSYTRFVAEYGDVERIDTKELAKLNPGWIQLKPGEESQPEDLSRFVSDIQIPVILEHSISGEPPLPEGVSLVQLNIDDVPGEEDLEALKEKWDMTKTIIHADWTLADIKKVCRIIQPLAWSIKTIIEKSPRKIDYPVMKKYIREISLW